MALISYDQPNITVSTAMFESAKLARQLVESIFTNIIIRQ